MRNLFRTSQTSQMADREVGRMKPEAKTATRKRMTAEKKHETDENNGRPEKKMENIKNANN